MNPPLDSALLDALRAHCVEDMPAAILPEGYKLHSLVRFQERPDGAVGTLTADSLTSLAEYVKQHKTGGTALFASRDNGSVKAFIDWHEDATRHPACAAPGWGRHTVEFRLLHTPEWKAWTGISGRKMSQADFAEFVEENLPDIIEPASAEVLEAIRTVSGERNISFKSAKNLANGDTQIIWKENTETAAGTQGEAALPSFLMLRLPVYRGAEKATTFDVKAFLRYRISEGKLSFELKLHRPEVAVDLAFDELVAGFRSALEADVPVYLGSVTAKPDSFFV